VQLSSGAPPTDYDAGDHVNLSPDGYTQMTNQINLAWLKGYEYVPPHA
jgi:hypothetical protein